MSTNSNLQQINVFNKGMNTDTSDAYLSSELYRYAENLRFITDTGENSGELRSIEGYLNLEGILNLQEQVIAVTAIRNLIIILSNDPHALIHVHNLDDPEHDMFPYIDSEFDWDPTIKYSLVTRWESDENVKLYIADGVHELMSLNIIKPDHYYISTDMLSGVGSDYLNPISCNISSEPGNIRAPLIQYCYYLYTEGSVRSDLSPLSRIITFEKLSENESSGKSVELRINTQLNNFKKIRVFRVEYVKNGASPNIYLIVDTDLTESAFVYTDVGSQVYSISFAEFQSLNKLHLKSKLIESKGDYLFLANVLDSSQEVDEKFKNVSVLYEVVDNDENYLYQLKFDGEFVKYSYNPSTNVYTTDKDKYGPSLMIGEVYRYGFVYYTSDGQKTSVLNITDVFVEEDKSFIKEIIPENTSINFRNDGVKFNRVGVRFTINNLPDDCIGYDVVRCLRTVEDSNTIAQGILGCTFGKDNGNFRYASSFMSLENFGCRDTGKPLTFDASSWYLSEIKSQSDLSMFASPESSYLMDDVMNALNTYKTGLKIKELKRYSVNSSSKNLSNSDARLPVTFLEGNAYYDHTLTNSLNGLFISHKGERLILFYYISPKDNIESSNLLGNVSEIAELRSPGRFDDGQSIQIGNDTTVVDNFEFINWDAWYLFQNGSLNTSQWPYANDLDVLNTAYAISSGKKCVLLKSDISKLSISAPTSGIVQSNLFPISVVNILRINTNPYGGFSDEVKKQNTFYSFGNYFVRAAGQANTVDVYDGDVYNCMFIYNSAHCWDSKKYSSLSNAVVYSVPVLTRIDLTQRTGDLWPDLLRSLYSYFFQDDAGSHSGLILDKPAYVYNTAYSLNSTARSSYKSDIKEIDSSIYDTRIFYSDPKVNGELVDSWTNFKAMNFLDVDSRYGEITGLRLFKNSLVYWQKNATGVLAVNERTMLLDVNDTNIILGNGDVLQRFDYLSLKYGMAKNQLCDAQSDGVLYWWDENNRDLIMYPGGQFVLPMKLAKTVSNIINKHSIENPTLAYDNKYKELLFSGIKFKIDGKDCIKSLVYNEMISLFTSIYDIKFQHKVELNDRLLLIDGIDINMPRVLQWNVSSLNLKNVILKYVVNDKSTFTKVYDNLQIGMGDPFFGDDAIGNPINLKDTNRLVVKDNILKFTFNTTSQLSVCETGITSREYDLRLAIPRDENAKYGNRMRGRTMQCELTSSSTEFSLQYIITKYRISWS